MVFETYSDLVGEHAFLSPSQPQWLRYSEEKLVERYLNSQAQERGTELHQFAHDAIRLNRIQPRNKDSLNMFINDAIGFKMSSEQPLYYHGFCFGTADAIQYKRNYLRIHDLKTGVVEGKMDQLKIYAALFCLNYQKLTHMLRMDGKSDIDIAAKWDLKPSELHFDPRKMTDIELRIYQYGDITVEHPDPEEILSFMDIIVRNVDVLKNVKAEV